jgi:hypothetical protein
MLNTHDGHEAKGTGVPWKEGFYEHANPYGYKICKRKKDREADRIRKVELELAGMKKRWNNFTREAHLSRRKIQHWILIASGEATWLPRRPHLMIM